MTNGERRFSRRCAALRLDCSAPTDCLNKFNGNIVCKATLAEATEKGSFVKSLLNDSLREKLDLLRQLAPEKIVAMYQEIAIKSCGEVRLRPRSFNHMIDVIIEHRDPELLE